jgi:hypothetical protein
MSTRSGDQQRKQRQKEFLERKKNQERLKAASKKAKRDTSNKEDEADRVDKSED